MNGLRMHELARQLWPLNRSLMGDGVRQTLRVLAGHVPGLELREVPSGTQAFDWVVPKEWRAREAWIRTPAGETICDFSRNNLHLVGYSTPVRATLTWDELQGHLHSLPAQPDAIPYITSYYQERWGFCIAHAQREQLPREGLYEVCIDTELFDGSLTYAEALLPGQTEQEVLLSTYVCHPSMANNELSGPVVTTWLAKWLAELRPRRFTYRIVFIPETIGSVVYLSRNLARLREKVVAGFNLTCIGDDRAYSYLPSRRGDTLADQAAQHVLRWTAPDHVRYTWNDRGSDERQYCAPHVDLPVASIMRTKYGAYPEYHTSLDDLENVVTPAGLEGGYEAVRRAIEVLERNCIPNVTVHCEPQLGKRGLYPTLSTKETAAKVRLMMNFLTWADGTRTLLDIADRCNAPVWELYPLLDTFRTNGLVEAAEAPARPERTH